MAELDERVERLERWCVALEEELRRVRGILASVGVVAAQAVPRTHDE